VNYPGVTALDMYLLTAWQFRVIPDYAGLAKLGYTVPEDQQNYLPQGQATKASAILTSTAASAVLFLL